MQQKKRLFGLKEKFLLTVLIPVALTFIVVGVYSRMSLNAFGEKIGSESTAIVTQFAENEILEKARAVAQEIELALQIYPELKPEELNSNPLLHELAIQKVGRTGYTVLWSVPEPNSDAAITLIHPAKELVGKNTPPLVKKRLGERYNAWFDIYSGAYKGDESKGYYLWEDGEGNLREKFMAIAPVKNTPYAVSATTYLDEFLDPVVTLENQISAQNRKIERVHLVTMGVGLLLVICFVLIGIQKISKQIVMLTKAITAASTGQVDDEIEVTKSNDELQDLAEAFERMRTGLKFIMQKLEKQSAKAAPKISDRN